MKPIIATALALSLATASVAALAQDKKSFDPYSQGAKAGDKFDPYSQGGKSGDKFDPYSQGANKSTRADLTDPSAAPKKAAKPGTTKAKAKKPNAGN